MTKLALNLLLLVTLSGCHQGYVRAEALDGTLNPVMDRHDAYVKADEGLSEIEKEVFLNSTLLLRKTIKEAKDPNSTK